MSQRSTKIESAQRKVISTWAVAEKRSAQKQETVEQAQKQEIVESAGVVYTVKIGGSGSGSGGGGGGSVGKARESERAFPGLDR
jgi:hypothetical protein